MDTCFRRYDRIGGSVYQDLRRLDDEERLAVFHGLTVFHQDLDDLAGLLGLDFVHELHGLYDAEHLPLFHQVAYLNVGRFVRRTRPVERADDGRGHPDLVRLDRGRLRRLFSRGCRGNLRNGRGDDGCGRILHARHGGMKGDVPAFSQPHLHAGTFDLDFRDIGALQHLDEFLDFLQVHDCSFGASSTVEDYFLTRSIKVPVRVSTLITAPVSRVAGLDPPDAVSPRTPGSVLAIASSTNIGTSMFMGDPLWYRTLISMFSLR